ncbi:MAG: virulence RhuM family protein [Streptococcaceae bacterium]|nr:virulence RhuM family protein [Streptococcaceae bacterium]MCL2681348.1 virulence RhuM family protein [Streptococcaceae bacterium]MCL2858771.1 virulence RhuM family protein [Streptococcaceae bacterium]
MTKENQLPQATNSQFLIYQTEDGKLKIDVRFDGDTVWLTQDQLVQLFQSSKANVSEHIKHIFEDGELEENSVVRKFRTTSSDGKNYNKKFYNLDMIISVGYRIKSRTATKFRQWATEHLREFIVKGFMLDDERLKNPDLPFDYFDELLARIQDIRTSERRFYQKITDIYATSIDYDPTEEMSILFFQTVQNKLHWAITGQTAAEIIRSRADAKKPNMGLTNWRGAMIRKSGVSVAKNYLNQEELSALNDIVEAYLTFAQAQANRRIPMYMKDWIEALDGFLTLSRRDVLIGAGKISHDLAIEHANSEYENFKQLRLSEQDKLPTVFDELLGGGEIDS